MFQLKYIGPTGCDCTAPYDVILDKEYTVREFVEAVLSEKPNEWGSIGICKKGSIFGDPCCEYRYGKLVNELPEDILNRKIKTVFARGGWTLMDYELILKRRTNA